MLLNLDKQIAAQAARLRLGIMLRVYSPSDAISWADEQIRQSDVPSTELIDLAVSDPASLHSVRAALEPLARPIDPVSVIGSVFTDAHRELLRNHDFGPLLARGLCELRSEYECEPPLGLEQMGWFDDAYAIAQAGMSPTEENVRDELLAFTKAAGDLAL